MNRENKILLYMHGGSGNHGCEAIINSLAHMLDQKLAVVTNSVAEDEKYSLGEFCELKEERQFSAHKMMHVLYYIWRKLRKDPESFIRYRYHLVFGKHFYPLALSVGGDNYCYENMLNDLKLANQAFHSRGTKTILLGCSIEPDMLKREDVRRDLEKYDVIAARESITYHALKEALETKKEEGDGQSVSGPRLFFFPDTAFTLQSRELPLPEGFVKGNTIGINISPMVQESEKEAGITLSNYDALIGHLIETTDMQIALIPHVVWARNDDRVPLLKLYDRYKDTGRVVLIGDGSCEELKGYIARCRMFIGARTHATIAAYSSLVPTIVVGYSIKARGIAEDLFGTSEHYVIPVQTLERKDNLIEAFHWLMTNENPIREKLTEVMPSYKEKARQAGKEVEKIWEELNMQPKI